MGKGAQAAVEDIPLKGSAAGSALTQGKTVQGDTHGFIFLPVLGEKKGRVEIPGCFQPVLDLGFLQPEVAILYVTVCNRFFFQ